MPRRPLWIIALALAPWAVGCRAFNDSSGLKPPPALGPRGVDQSVAAEVVGKLNANALKVTSLKAKPEVSLSGKRLGGAVHGLLAVQTPRDFRLQLEAMGGRSVADLGSNRDGFWFWTQDKESMQYPVGRYDADGNPPPGVPLTYQPDFFAEALGLREIPAAAVARMKVERIDPTTIKLIQSLKSPGGESFSKVLIVDEATKQVRERQIRGPDGGLMASAKVTGTQSIRLPAVEGEVTSDTATLPRKLTLMMLQGGEKLTLLVDLREITLNDTLPEGLFVEPDKRAEGYTRVDLGADRPAVASSSGPRTRTTRPAPAVRLGDPVGVDDELPKLPEGVVGPREPTAPRSLSPSSAVRAASFDGSR